MRKEYGGRAERSEARSEALRRTGALMRVTRNKSGPTLVRSTSVGCAQKNYFEITSLIAESKSAYSVKALYCGKSALILSVVRKRNPAFEA